MNTNDMNVVEQSTEQNSRAKCSTHDAGVHEHSLQVIDGCVLVVVPPPINNAVDVVVAEFTRLFAQLVPKVRNKGMKS
jgi:hypothetical protein